MTTTPPPGAAAEVELREQRLQVATVSVAVERVVLRRRIVTEVQQIQVTVRREELEIVREPLSGQPTGAPGAAQPPLLIVLSREVPVVQLQRHPYELVTARVTSVQGQQQINESVSKEQAELTTTGNREGAPPMTAPDDGSKRVTVLPHRGGRDVTAAPPAKTSAAAVFALVFGLAALFCALTAILSPAAIVFAVIGLILAVVGLKMAKKPGVTGKGVAVGGLVTALLGLILGGVIIGGLAAVVNNKSQLDRIQQYLDDAKAKLPSFQQARNSIPGK